MSGSRFILSLLAMLLAFAGGGYALHMKGELNLRSLLQGESTVASNKAPLEVPDVAAAKPKATNGEQGTAKQQDTSKQNVEIANAEGADSNAGTPVTSTAKELEPSGDVVSTPRNGETRTRKEFDTNIDVENDPSAETNTPPNKDEPESSVTTDSGSTGLPSPSFDIINYSDDGNAVLAGRAEPGAEIIITANDAVVGTTIADTVGAWAVIPQTPLQPGNYVIALFAQRKGDEQSRVAGSKQVKVFIPSSSEENATVALADTDQPDQEIVVAEAEQTPTGNDNDVVASSEQPLDATANQDVADSKSNGSEDNADDPVGELIKRADDLAESATKKFSEWLGTKDGDASNKGKSTTSETETSDGTIVTAELPKANDVSGQSDQTNSSTSSATENGTANITTETDASNENSSAETTATKALEDNATDSAAGSIEKLVDHAGEIAEQAGRTVGELIDNIISSDDTAVPTTKTTQPDQPNTDIKTAEAKANQNNTGESEVAISKASDTANNVTKEQTVASAPDADSKIAGDELGKQATQSDVKAKTVDQGQGAGVSKKAAAKTKTASVQRSAAARAKSKARARAAMKRRHKRKLRRAARRKKLRRRKQVASYRRKIKSKHFRRMGLGRTGRKSKSRRRTARVSRQSHNGRWYRVRRGDTLWAIAKTYYGRGMRYRRIYRSNRDQIQNPNLIYPNQRLRIPARKRS